MFPSLRLSKKPVALGSISLFVIGVCLVCVPAISQALFSLYAIIVGTNIDLLFYTDVMTNMVWLNAIPPIIGGALLCVFASRLIRSHYKFDAVKVKHQSLHLMSWALITLITVSCFIALTLPTSEAMNTATTGYILDTPVSNFDFLIGNYSNGNIYAINGSNWDNLMGGVGSIVWAPYTTNYTKVEELALSALSSGGGKILCKNVAFNLALMGSIPVNVSVTCSYGSQEYTYINPSSSVGSPYTVSVGQGLNGGYYQAADSAGRICWSSTNAYTIINNVVTSNSQVFVKSGTYTLTGQPLFTGLTNFVFAGEGNSTIFKVAASTNINAFNITGCSGLVLRDFQIDGNRANNVYQDSYWMNAGIMAGNDAGTNGNTNCLFENLYIHDTAGDGIVFRGGSDSTIKNNWVSNTLRDGILVTLADNLLITENNVASCGSLVDIDNKWHSIYTYGNNHVITENIITDGGGDGIETYGLFDGIISENIIKDVGRNGIYVQSSAGGDQAIKVTVSSNEVFNTGLNANWTENPLHWQFGIYIAAPYYGCNDNYVENAGGVGLYITSGHGMVTSNTIVNSTTIGLSLYQINAPTTLGANSILGTGDLGLSLNQVNYTTVSTMTIQQFTKVNTGIAVIDSLYNNFATISVFNCYGSILEQGTSDYNMYYGINANDMPIGNSAPAMVTIGANSHVAFSWNRTSWIP